MREGRKYPKPQKSVHQLVRRLPIRGSFLGQIVTVGNDATSSLLIVTVALAGLPTVYAAFALKVAMTVSSLSTTVSSIGVTVIVALAAVAGIVTLVPMLV